MLCLSLLGKRARSEELPRLADRNQTVGVSSGAAQSTHVAEILKIPHEPSRTSATPEMVPLDSYVVDRPKPYYEWGATARSYYQNDQRIEFTGQEATFGVEGILNGAAMIEEGEREFGVFGELFFNQPFDRNILVDTPERASYAHNFDFDPVTISQLYLAVHRDIWTVSMGKMLTPFGRYHIPIYSNSWVDSPFIRSEAIQFRETGLLIECNPNRWRLATGVFNGGLDRDANSSKGLISRIGWESERFELGTSIKWQDGIGSEGQKQYNNHVGLDGAFRLGRLTFSSEIIYDEYGSRRPGLDLNDITWGRSLYFRELNLALNEPITGWGYYGHIHLDGGRWGADASYGEFLPEQIGNAIHDHMTRRLILKGSHFFQEHVEGFVVVMLENTVPNAQSGSTRNGLVIHTGAQWLF